jgi:hypothetical protein
MLIEIDDGENGISEDSGLSELMLGLELTV